MKINEILTEDIEQLDELNWKKAAAAATLAGAGLFGGGQAADAQSLLHPALGAAMSAAAVESDAKNFIRDASESDILKMAYYLGQVEAFYEAGEMNAYGERKFRQMKTLYNQVYDTLDLPKKMMAKLERKKGFSNAKSEVGKTAKIPGYKELENLVTDVSTKKMTGTNQKTTDTSKGGNQQKPTMVSAKPLKILGNNDKFTGEISYSGTDILDGVPIKDRFGAIIKADGTIISGKWNGRGFIGPGELRTKSGEELKGKFDYWTDGNSTDYHEIIFYPNNKSDVQKITNLYPDHPYLKKQTTQQTTQPAASPPKAQPKPPVKMLSPAEMKELEKSFENLPNIKIEK